MPETSGSASPGRGKHHLLALALAGLLLLGGAVWFSAKFRKAESPGERVLKHAGEYAARREKLVKAERPSPAMLREQERARREFFDTIMVDADPERLIETQLTYQQINSVLQIYADELRTGRPMGCDRATFAYRMVDSARSTFDPFIQYDTLWNIVDDLFVQGETACLIDLARSSTHVHSGSVQVFQRLPSALADSAGGEDFRAHVRSSIESAAMSGAENCQLMLLRVNFLKLDDTQDSDDRIRLLDRIATLCPDLSETIERAIELINMKRSPE